MYQDVTIWVSECLSSQYNLHLCDRRSSRRTALGKSDFEVWIHSRHQFWRDWNDCVSFSFDKFSGLVSFQALFPRRYHLSKCVGWRCHNWVFNRWICLRLYVMWTNSCQYSKILLILKKYKSLDSPLLGPYISEGPRMTVQFGSTTVPPDNLLPLGFKAQIDFKTGKTWILPWV